MPANCPNNPTVGQQYSYGGATWSCSGAHWQTNQPELSGELTANKQSVNNELKDLLFLIN